MATLARNVLHLVAWGQTGVIIRYYLKEAFLQAGVTSTAGALFADLPANLLGSCTMGLLSPAELLLLGGSVESSPSVECGTGNGPDAGGHAPPPVERVPQLPAGLQLACAALPPGSGLQRHAPLLLGLRTGLCGCLTTYASWCALRAVRLPHHVRQLVCAACWAVRGGWGLLPYEVTTPLVLLATRQPVTCG
jgi:fluoride ion exporter CrcB/FEX